MIHALHTFPAALGEEHRTPVWMNNKSKEAKTTHPFPRGTRIDGDDPQEPTVNRRGEVLVQAVIARGAIL